MILLLKRKSQNRKHPMKSRKVSRRTNKEMKLLLKKKKPKINTMQLWEK